MTLGEQEPELPGGSAAPVTPTVLVAHTGALTLLRDAVLLDEPLHDVIPWGPRQR